MFWVEIVAAISSANTQTGIDLKTPNTSRIEQLDRNWAFPISTALGGIEVYTGRGIEDMLGRGADRKSRQRKKGVFDLLSIAMEDVRIEAIVDMLPVLARRCPLQTGRLAFGRKLTDLIDE